MTIQSQIVKNKDKDKEEADEISFKEILVKIRVWRKYILSKWIYILAFGILGGVAGYCYAIFKKPVYTAITTFVLEEGGSNSGTLGNLGGLASMAGINLGGGGGGLFQGDNLMELYKSRSMIEKTLFSEVSENGKNELLINKYIEFKKLRKSWKDKPNLQRITFNLRDENAAKDRRLKDSIIGTIVNDIRINYLNVSMADKKTSIVNAVVKSEDEFFAKTFNDQIVKNVNDFYIQTRTKKSLDNVRILQEKVDSVRAVMNGSIHTAAKVADATPNLNPTRQIQRVEPVQRAQFSAETNKLILNELVKNLELSKMSLMKEAPLIQVIDQPVYPLDMDRLGKAKGIVIGAFVLSFLAILVLVFRKFMTS